MKNSSLVIVLLDPGVAFTLRPHLKITTCILTRTWGDLFLQHTSPSTFALAREGVKYLHQVIVDVTFCLSFRGYQGNTVSASRCRFPG